MRKINKLFTCVGAQKSGTTWLSSVLEKHPKIVMGVHKELHYFDYVHNGYDVVHQFRYDRLKRLIENQEENIIKLISGNINKSSHFVAKMMKACLDPVSDDWYVSMFEDLKPDQYALDFSPEYAIIGPRGFKHMQRLARNIKVLFNMRNPVERSLSCMMHWEDRDSEKVRLLEDHEIIDRLNDVRNVNLNQYTLTIEHLKSCFHPNDLLFKFYDEIEQNPQQYLNDILNFLSIEPHESINELINERIFTSPKIDFSDEVKDYLRNKYRPIVIELEKVLKQVPLSWKEEFKL